jgi:hypothetical protein
VSFLQLQRVKKEFVVVVAIVGEAPPSPCFLPTLCHTALPCPFSFGIFRQTPLEFVKHASLTRGTFGCRVRSQEARIGLMEKSLRETKEREEATRADLASKLGEARMREVELRWTVDDLRYHRWGKELRLSRPLKQVEGDVRTAKVSPPETAVFSVSFCLLLLPDSMLRLLQGLLARWGGSTVCVLNGVVHRSGR